MWGLTTRWARWGQRPQLSRRRRGRTSRFARAERLGGRLQHGREKRLRTMDTTQARATAPGNRERVSAADPPAPGNLPSATARVNRDYLDGPPIPEHTRNVSL